MSIHNKFFTTDLTCEAIDALKSLRYVPEPAFPSDRESSNLIILINAYTQKYWITDHTALAVKIDEYGQNKIIPTITYNDIQKWN